MGNLLVILSAFGFSTLGIFGKWSYEAGFSRNQMLFFRFAFAVPILFLILFLRRELPQSKRLFLRSLLLGAVGIGVEATFYFLTLEHLGAALTGIFLYLYPTFVALIAALFLKEKLAAKKWIFISLALLGCVFTTGLLDSGTEKHADILGIIYGICTGLWYAIYLTIGNRILKQDSPLAVSTGIVSGAFITFAILTAIEVSQGAALKLPLPNAGFGVILGMAILASVLPFATLYAGMKRIGPIATSILSTLELVFTIILAAIFLGEKLTLFQGVGASLILLSVLLASLFR